MYTAEPAANGEGGIDNLHQRFREGEMALFEKQTRGSDQKWRGEDAALMGASCLWRAPHLRSS